jgi:hypothetical protein
VTIGRIDEDIAIDVDVDVDVDKRRLVGRDLSLEIQGVPPTHEHLRIKGVSRNSAGVETFFTPHTLHPLH